MPEPYDDYPIYVVPYSQVKTIAGRRLTDEELEQISVGLQYSPVDEVVESVVKQVLRSHNGEEHA